MFNIIKYILDIKKCKTKLRQQLDFNKLKFGADGGSSGAVPGGPPPPPPPAQPKPKKVQPLHKQVASKITLIGSKMGELMSMESRLKQPDLGLIFVSI